MIGYLVFYGRDVVGKSLLLSRDYYGVLIVVKRMKLMRGWIFVEKNEWIGEKNEEIEGILERSRKIGYFFVLCF